MNSTVKSSIYDDALLYDLIHTRMNGDYSFYLRLAEQHPGQVLELGCGTGRISVALAEQGLQVTGIDIAEQMLNRARENAKSKKVDVELVYGDMTNFDLSRKFKLILLPSNALSHLLDADSIDSCLSCIHRHLDGDGRFTIQIFNPDLRILTRDENERYPVAELDNPYGNGIIRVMESNHYDKAQQINRIKWFYKFPESNDDIVIDLPLRIYYPQELDMLLRSNGFEIERKFGAFDGSDFTSDSMWQIPVCRKR